MGNDDQIFRQEDPVESDDNQSKNIAMSSRLSKDKNNDTSYSLILDDQKPYKCKQCDFQSAIKGNVKKHVQYKHEGIKYPCQQCDFQATQQGSLQQHIKSKHQGTKYPCQLCDFKSTHPVYIIILN